ncbi:thioredoxin H4-1-like [Hibiscus syriacus]|uniref:thioredoxin H4-1-like n=1 Tax=Hibiscus syriacus TaxID=106335 RepID=UPI001923E932|nr:thioredoxin H4-1-like [Hibiscus syriacus]
MKGINSYHFLWIHFLLFESYELIFIESIEAYCNFVGKGRLGKWDSVGASSCSSSSVLKRNNKGKQKKASGPEPASKNIHHITTIQSWEESLTEATRDGKTLVANFSAPWSAPCKSIAPVYSELADKYTSLMFLTVDVDALAEFSNSWEISATPTFIFIKEGRQVDKFVGADKVELKKKIAAVAACKF